MLGHDAEPEAERLSDESRAALLASGREAFELYRQSLKSRFRAAPAAYAAGRVCEMAGHPGEALAHYRRALEASDAEPWPRLLNSIVRCARAVGGEREVAAWLVLYSEAMPVVDLWAGHLLHAAEAPEEAAPVLERCLERVGEADVRYPAVTELLEVLWALGRVDTALNVCRRAMAWFPERAASLGTALAGMLTGAGRIDEALEMAASVLEAAPDHGPAHLVQAVALLRYGDGDRARAALQHARHLEPALAERAEAILAELA